MHRYQTPASCTRRRFLETMLQRGAMAAGIGSTAVAMGAQPAPLSQRPAASDHTLIAISGTPRQRGRAYGRRFAGEIRQFLQAEIYGAFVSPEATKDAMLRYAAACVAPIRRLSSQLLEEMEGIAEGASLRLEEVVLLSLHEELWHRGAIPSIEHCTATAVGPPVTADGKTYVAMSWDWFPRLYGQSQMLLWQREDGPSVLSYSYPGLWIGAGLNSAGIALCWTSAGMFPATSRSSGVPTYALIAHLLYQPTLDRVIEEARRATRAGWFTFVMADGNGRLLSVEGSPEKLAVEDARGSLVRVYYGTREMTGTLADEPVLRHPQCQRMVDLVAASTGRIDRPVLQRFYGDHESTICKHFGTLDVLVFDLTSREAYVTRGPGCLGQWQPFSFQSQPSVH